MNRSPRIKVSDAVLAAIIAKVMAKMADKGRKPASK